ncbi:hypothetical protein C0J52_20818 [Blattella germanica]|nr:hypothetical protein C0J52_20818 [Blattella germanica]
MVQTVSGAAMFTLQQLKQQRLINSQSFYQRIKKEPVIEVHTYWYCQHILNKKSPANGYLLLEY